MKATFFGLVVLLILMSLSNGAFAKSYSRKFGCLPPGHTGVSMKGVYIMETKKVNGALSVISTKIKIESFSFLINGLPGSSIPAFEAVTRKNGDGDDRVSSRYSKTTSKRILSIGLVISEENDEQDLTVVKTSKGNTYASSCNFLGTAIN